MTYFTGDDRAVVAARSNDLGARWRRSVLPGLTSCTGGPPGQVVDPDLAFAADGSLLSTSGWVKSSPRLTDRDHDAIRQFAARSIDGGASWSAPVDVGQAMPYQRGFLASAARGDELLETERAPFLATTYAFLEPSSIDVLRTGDDGRTWVRTAAIPSAPGRSLLAAGLLRSGDVVTALGVDVTVVDLLSSVVESQLGLSDGSASADLVAAVSTDGGRSFAPPTTIDTCFGVLTCNLPASTTAPDGSLIVTYTVKGAGGTSTLRMARSTDAGRTWQRHDVSTLTRAPDIAAVAARPGQIGVLALEPADGGTSLYRAVLHTSSDAGASWSALQLAGPFDKKTITYSHFDGQLGPEIDLAALPGGFGAVYPVLGPYPLLDGQQDVVFQRIVVCRPAGHPRRCGRHHHPVSTAQRASRVLAGRRTPAPRVQSRRRARVS